MIVLIVKLSVSMFQIFSGYIRLTYSIFPPNIERKDPLPPTAIAVRFPFAPLMASAQIIPMVLYQEDEYCSCPFGGVSLAESFLAFPHGTERL